MVETVDFNSFLRKGYWPNSKAKSPGPETKLFDSTVAAGQQYFPDPAVPRQLPYNVTRPITYTYKWPPPPSVEDETDSLAKEHGSVASSVPSEEPVYRGEPDQHPILLPVNEHSSERRFVIVSSSSEASDESSTETKKSRRKLRSSERWSESESTTCESVTSHKSRPSTPYEDKKKLESRSLRDRRRLEDLPTIVTNLGACTPGSRDISRANSATRPDFPEDYFSPRPSSSAYYSPRPSSHYQSGTVSTPNVSDQNRSYHDSVSYHRRHHSALPDQYGRNFPTDRKLKESLFRSAQPSPTYLKRYPESPGPSRRPSKENYELSRQYSDSSSPKSHRKTPTSSHNHAEWETSSQHSSSSREKRSSPSGSGHYDSSDEELRLRSLSRHRRTSTLPEKVTYLGTPTEPRLIDRRRAKGASPLPSPQICRTSYFDKAAMASSPLSMAFVKEPRTPREDGRPERPLSRASTVTSDKAGSAPLKTPAVVASVNTSSADPRRSVPTLSARRPALKSSSSRSSPPTPLTPSSSSPSLQRSMRPQRIELSRRDTNMSKHMTPYGRYLQELKSRELPDIPPCPRTREVAGHNDWLTLPHCDNFNICPSCYQANFANTEFAYHFVQAPARTSDRPIACDFGTSQYYHIAWLFTRKYNKPDLSLFRSLAKIGAKSQPCSGYHEATRIWYSVKEPRTQRAIPNFTVCHSCAKAVEALLPSLMGLFVPMDSPAEPTKGVCAMHQTADGRKRFVLYFDLLETAADQALATKSPPDVQALADRIRELALAPECAGSRPLRNKRWYTMKSVPDMVVCEACFEEVVWPYLGRDGGSGSGGNSPNGVGGSGSSGNLAEDFVHRPQRLHLAACMLHSDRMRDIFHRAVRRRDTMWLSDKVTERYEKEREYHARLAELNNFALGPAEVDAEIEKLLREWKKWE
ncbi:hypothetical protein F4775DRAFT_590396 [Biscogniauxia sp. FL1348]|nr:hypothetical protein F4775DRAFT_590396 [Biscogniauxia sp. FL1348]